jgi:hypothetical protein
MEEEVAIKKKKGVLDFPRILLYLLAIFALVFVLSFLYFSTRGNKDYTGVYSENAQKEVVESLITSLKLYNVHEIPYFGITPKMQIYITENTFFVNAYYIEIVKGEVIIKDGEANETDIIIRTTEEEVMKVINDSNYMKESLSSGRTTVEKATSDFVLFTKGYPDIFIK